MPEAKDVASIQQAIQILQGVLQSEQSEPEVGQGGLKEVLQKKVAEGGGLA